MSADYGRIARVTFVVAGLAGLYPLADYLARNNADAIQRRYDAENAAAIAALPEAYVKNAYHVIALEEEFGPVSCATAVKVVPVAASAANDGGCIMPCGDRCD